MHLNYDCLRNVLLALEKLLEIQTGDSYEFCMISIQELMNDPGVARYPEEDVFYCVHNLEQAGFVKTCRVESGIYVHDLVVFDITYAGHMFLRNISSETVWTMVKKKFGPAISASLPVVQQLAGQIILNQLSQSS